MADDRRTIDDSSGDSQKTGHAEGKEEEDDNITLINEGFTALLITIHNYEQWYS